jgi:integrative and conjugative element protein (TIGR02256 family)
LRTLQPTELRFEGVGRVILTHEALLKLRHYRQRFWQNERGGVLAGSLSLDGSWIVSHVMPPSMKSQAGRYWFKRDPASASQYLDDLFEDSNGTIFYLGEWHTHPAKSTEPSEQDTAVIADLIPQSSLVADFLICIIVDSKSKVIVWCQSASTPLGAPIIID